MAALRCHWRVRAQTRVSHGQDGLWAAKRCSRCRLPAATGAEPGPSPRPAQTRPLFTEHIQLHRSQGSWRGLREPPSQAARTDRPPCKAPPGGTTCSPGSRSPCRCGPSPAQRQRPHGLPVPGSSSHHLPPAPGEPKDRLRLNRASS